QTQVARLLPATAKITMGHGPVNVDARTHALVTLYVRYTVEPRSAAVQKAVGSARASREPDRSSCRPSGAADQIVVYQGRRCACPCLFSWRPSGAAASDPLFHHTPPGAQR